MAVLYLLTDVLGVWYVLSALAAYAASFAVSFGLQRNWTFGHRGADGAWPHLVGYLALFGFNMGLNAGLLYLLVDRAGLPHMLAQLILVVVIAIWNFAAMRYLVFRPASPPAR